MFEYFESRPLAPIGHIPPAEAEQCYYETLAKQTSEAVLLYPNALLKSRGDSILQWIGKYFRLNALQKQHVANYSAKNLFHNLNDLEHWQNAQCMVVSHDNENGQIKQIQVLQSLTLSG